MELELRADKPVKVRFVFLWWQKPGRHMICPAAIDKFAGCSLVEHAESYVAQEQLAPRWPSGPVNQDEKLHH